MPTRDNFSNQIVTEGVVRTILQTGQVTVTKGTIIDTADYDMGIMFALSILSMANSGTHVLSFEEGDDPTLADAVVVGSEKIIGDTMIADAETDQTGPWPGNGLFGTKRYVRAMVSSSNLIGENEFQVTAVLSGEYNFQGQ